MGRKWLCLSLSASLNETFKTMKDSHFGSRIPKKSSLFALNENRLPNKKKLDKRSLGFSVVIRN